MIDWDDNNEELAWSGGIWMDLYVFDKSVTVIDFNGFNPQELERKSSYDFDRIQAKFSTVRHQNTLSHLDMPSKREFG